MKEDKSSINPQYSKQLNYLETLESRGSIALAFGDECIADADTLYGTNPTQNERQIEAAVSHHRWTNWNYRELDGNGLIEISLPAACSRAGHGQVCERRSHDVPIARVLYIYVHTSRSRSRLHVSPTRPYAPLCAWIYAHDARRCSVLLPSSHADPDTQATSSNIELWYTGGSEAARDA